MAVTSGFFNAINNDRLYSSTQMSMLFDGIITDGIFASIGTSFIVSAGTADMNVVVGVGRAWFNHTWLLNDTGLVLPVDTSELILRRIDVVILDFDSTDNVRANTIKIVKGVPGSNPVAPTMINTPTHHQYAIAHIEVGNGVTSIEQSKITNKVGTAETPFITGILETLDTDNLFLQWEAEFDASLSAQDLEFQTWFDAINAQLTGGAATALQLQINTLNTTAGSLQTQINAKLAASSKATAANVTAGTDDTSYVTSLAIKNSVNVPNVIPSTSGNVMTSNGTAWVSSAHPAVPAVATGAEVATGTDNVKIVTAKAIKDSVNVPDVAPGTSGNVMTSNGSAWVSSAHDATPVKATGAEVVTGTDDAKFVTAKAIKDSVNVPNVAPSTSGNVLTSNGSTWTSSPPASATVKATAAEVTAGTEDTKFVTALAIKNSVNVPNVAPSAAGNGMISNGVNWVSNPTSNRNAIINGAMDIWQRGTSFTNISAAIYTADRWQTYRVDLGSTCSKVVNSDTTNLPALRNCMRIQRTAGGTGTNSIALGYSLESLDASRFAGKYVTLSFYARCGSNYSNAGNALQIALLAGTGTDQSVIYGYIGSANLTTVSRTLTTTWQRFMVTVSVTSLSTEMGMLFTFAPTGTAGANDYYDITGVQLEEGSVATPFEFRHYAQELALCKRYFERMVSTGQYFHFATGRVIYTTVASVLVVYQVAKRTAPSVSYGPSVSDFRVLYTDTSQVCTAVTPAYIGVNAMTLGATVPGSLTPGQSIALMDAGSGTAYVDISAEL